MENRIKSLVQSSAFQNGILGLILAAAVLVGLETYPNIMEQHGDTILFLDKIILWLFVLEAALKMAQHGRRFYRYFHDPWNVFDFTIVAICFMPFDGHYAAVLRLARILRALRLVSTVPKLQLLVGSLLKSIPSMFYVGILLTIMFYIYGVMGVFLWGKNDPVHFRDLTTSVLSLFRVVTLEDWTDLMYIQMKGSDVYPYENTTGIETIPSASPILSPLYFVSFVLLGTMIMLNLFIGVIISSMDEAHEEQEALERKRRLREHDPPTVEDEIMVMEKQLSDFQKTLRSLRKRMEADAED